MNKFYQCSEQKLPDILLKLENKEGDKNYRESGKWESSGLLLPYLALR